MHGWGAPPPPPGHEREGPDGRGGPNGPPPGMVMGPQGALFGFGGPHGQGHPGGPPMGYNMMPNMIPQGMQMQGNALAYMPWFPQMAPMGQMGMQGYGMGGIPGMPIPGGELGGTDDAQRKRRERDETNMKWASLDSLAPPASCNSPAPSNPQRQSRALPSGVFRERASQDLSLDPHGARGRGRRAWPRCASSGMRGFRAGTTHSEVMCPV